MPQTPPSDEPKNWKVEFTKSASKLYEKLKRSGSKPSPIDAIDLLVMEMEKFGPERADWPNYCILKGTTTYHCHLQKRGSPTYVVCWQVIDKINNKIEVNYVGTREGSPY